MVEVSTSLLNVKKEELLAVIYNLEIAKTDYFHIDVMDGKFVKKNTSELMQEYANNIKQISNLPIDVHLMVKNIRTYIDDFIPFQPNIITFHIEACENKNEILDIIKYLKDNNIKAGIAVKPNTNIEEVYDFLHFVHMVLVMTVEPGEGGQKLIESTIDKVKKINKYVKSNQLEIDIEVDGGINESNVELLKEAGANIFVAGSYIINSKNYSDSINKIKE